MRIAILGRSELLYDTAVLLRKNGNAISCIITAQEAPEYLKTAGDFALLAKELEVPYSCSSRITENISMLADVKSDIAVSVNYPCIIPEVITDLFPYGILNAHGGDLPRYRGNACQAWAILNGEPRIGLCVHKMVGGELDSGDIIVRDYLPIDHTTKITTVHHWLNERIPPMFLQAVNILQTDPGFVLESQSKDPNGALRCYPRRPMDGRINWHQTALQILRLINASNKPYGGAFCEFEGEPLIIWDAELVSDNEQFCAVPGQVTNIGDGYIEVACAEGKLRLKQIEMSESVGSPSDRIKSLRKRLT